MSDVEPTKNCYNCGNAVSIYEATCNNCGAAHDPEPRPAKTEAINPTSLDAPPPAPIAPKTEPQPSPVVVKGRRKASSGPTLKSWLAENGMLEHLPAFEENGIDLDLLKDLSDSDLKELGVAKMGDRKRLLKSITELSKAIVPSQPMLIQAPVPAVSRPAASGGGGGVQVGVGADLPSESSNVIGCIGGAMSVVLLAIFFSGASQSGSFYGKVMFELRDLPLFDQAWDAYRKDIATIGRNGKRNRTKRIFKTEGEEVSKPAQPKFAKAAKSQQQAEASRAKQARFDRYFDCHVLCNCLINSSDWAAGRVTKRTGQAVYGQGSSRAAIDCKLRCDREHLQTRKESGYPGTAQTNCTAATLDKYGH